MDLRATVPVSGLTAARRFSKAASEQLGIKGDVFLKRGIFFDGEFVVSEDVEEAACFWGSRFAQQCCKLWNGSLFAEEKKVGNCGLLAGDLREAINTDFLFEIRCRAREFVEVFKEAAVEEWNGFVQLLNRGFLNEKLEMAEVALVAIVLILALIDRALRN